MTYKNTSSAGMISNHEVKRNILL